MIFPDSVFAGISVSRHHKAFTHVVLDKGLNLLALADGNLDDVSAFLAGQRAVVVAVNAPSGLNRNPVVEKKKELFKSKREGALAEYRLAEAELRTRGIIVPGTPSKLDDCPDWMKNGFALYQRLEKAGFVNYPADGAEYTIFETNSHASFCMLAGETPAPKTSLEGKIQRQLLLYENGLRIKDPMDFFEEITRHKMLKGIWPVELLYAPDQLDAMAAALTAWLTVHKPEVISTFGNIKEGTIILPDKK